MINSYLKKHWDSIKQPAVRQPIVENAPMHRLVIDLVDLNAYIRFNSGYRYLLDCIDAFTQYTWSFPIKRKKPEDVRECLEKIFVTFGPPAIVQSDNGGEFIGAELTNWLGELGVRVINSSAYHPQSQGRVERFNQTIERELGKRIGENGNKRWIDYLANANRSYNCTIHNTTKQTPFRVMFGRDPPQQWSTLSVLLKSNSVISKKYLPLSVPQQQQQLNGGHSDQTAVELQSTSEIGTILSTDHCVLESTLGKIRSDTFELTSFNRRK